MTPFNLTICYMTSREEPRIEWFYHSLFGQCVENKVKITGLIIDFHNDEPGRGREMEKDLFSKYPDENYDLSFAPHFLRKSCKPCVWQGPHRKTREDFFAASNARNTALCLCETEYICYVDDLSVAMPGWLARVIEACKHDRVTLGAYRKVHDLVVNDAGIVTSFRDAPLCHDIRRGGPEPVPCGGGWLYGCSLVGPVEHFLRVGGWPEALCDGMGYEDTTMGTMMANAGTKFVYDVGMMTWESEELHHVGKKMRREDYGKSPFDKSHAVVHASRNIRFHENYFGPEGIRGLRQRVLSGEPFPVPLIPEHEWFTSRRLEEL